MDERRSGRTSAGRPLPAPIGPPRPARPGDVGRQQAVERAAGARFADVGLAAIAADEPMSAETLGAYCRAGRSWVATDLHGSVVGYVVVDTIDACAHIEQVSVDPAHQGHGLGRALIDEVERWATARDLEGITLATFTDVPWNRPLYEHLGFLVLADDQLSPGLRSLRDREAAHGLASELRVCMHRPTARSAPAADPSGSADAR
jgi:GNAT superfamily N-acetyltransferase